MALVPDNQYAANTNDFQKFNYPTASFLINKDTNTLEYSEDNKALMAQSLEILLQIERYKYRIFTSKIGMETIDLPGQDIDFIISSLKRRINGCIKCDDRVYGMSNFNVTNIDEHSILANFTANTIFGDIDMEEKYSI